MTRDEFIAAVIGYAGAAAIGIIAYFGLYQGIKFLFITIGDFAAWVAPLP